MDRLRRLLEEGAAVLLALTRPAARSVRDNVGLAALSIVLAFGLWIFVTDTEDETRIGIPPIDITVEPVNPAADVTVANEISSVRVRLRVDQDVWDSLTPADFKATVSLEGLSVGIYDLPVKVTAQTSRGGLSVIEPVPDTVEVDLEPLFSKSVPVTVQVAGSPPEGYTQGVAEADDEAALITGPQAKVTLVSQAAAPIDVSGRTERVDQSVRLEPRDQNGFLVQGVTVEPGVSKVSVEIEQVEYSKVVIVSPDIRGQPARGYNIVATDVEPPTVTIFGPKDFIEETRAIRTKPVDIADAENDVVRSVSLDLPSGTSVSGGVSVTVTVDIEPASGQVSFVVPVSAYGLAGGLSVLGGLPSVEVLVLGPVPELLDVRPNDISATVDLEGLGKGTHTVSVKVTVPGGLLAAGVQPEEIKVQLEE